MANYRTDGSSALEPNYDDDYNPDNTDGPSIIPFSDIPRRASGLDQPGFKAIRGGAALNAAEKSAASANNFKVIPGGKASPAGAIAKTAESAPSFISNVTGQNTKSGQSAGKFKWLKKGTPLGIISALLLGFFGIMMGVPALMPFSLMAQLQDTFDSIRTSAEQRADVFRVYQLDPDRVKNPIQASMFGNDKFKITEKQASHLASQGIEVDNEYEMPNGKKITVLRFDDGSGFEPIVVAPNEKYAKEIEATNKHSTVTTFDKAYSEIADFRNGYISSSRTWRGSAGAWFDKTTTAFLKKYNITRNLFNDYINRVDSEEAGNTKSASQLIAERASGETSVSASTRTTTDDQTPMSDSNEKLSSKELKAQTREQAKAAVQNFSNKYAGTVKASGVASGLSEATCGVMGFIGVVNLMVAADQMQQQLTVASAYLEAIDKTKAGEGSSALLSELMNTLTQPADLTTYNENNELVTVRKNTTAMEAQSVSALYGGAAVNPADASIQNTSINSMTNHSSFFSKVNNAVGNISLSIGAFTACAVAKMGSALLDAGIDVAMAASCVVEIASVVGIPACLAEVGISAIVNIGVSATIAIAIGKSAPYVADLAFNALSKNVVDNLAGEDLGNTIVPGSHSYMSTNHRIGGGSLTNEKTYLAYQKLQRQSLDNQAKLARSTLNPFDASSKYTFLGSITTQLIGLDSQTKSVSNAPAAIANITRNAIASITSGAYAAGATTTIGNCPDLEAIGAIGDAFCNPYIITDTSTIQMDPADVIDKVSGSLMSGESETPRIAKGSNLAKYIVFCENRTSPFGVIDQNFANALADGSWDSTDVNSSMPTTILNSTKYSIPIVGDMIGVFEDSKTLANIRWIDGEACVASDSNPNWAENKYYQRFSEDQRLAENMGLIDKSAVTAFMEEYYQENPIDNSYAGQIAARTGMLKEDVNDVLAILEYTTWLASYDPSTRHNFIDDNINYDAPLNLATNAPTDAPTTPNTIRYITYYDIRNRTQTS